MPFLAYNDHQLGVVAPLVEALERLYELVQLAPEDTLELAMRHSMTAADYHVGQELASNA